MPNETHHTLPLPGGVATLNDHRNTNGSTRRNSHGFNGGQSRPGVASRTSTAPLTNAADARDEYVSLTIQSLIRSAEAVDHLDDDSLYAVCKRAVQHGRPRSHAHAVASMTRSRSTRARLSYEELHHLMAATISGVELCDFIPGPVTTSSGNSTPSSTTSRSRRAQKVLVNFCPMPKMHYFYNALTLPEISQNYYDDIYLRPNACLSNSHTDSSLTHHQHHQHRHRDVSSSSNDNDCCTSTTTGSSTTGGRRLTTVKGLEGVTPSPSATLPDTNTVQEVAPSSTTSTPDAIISREGAVEKSSGSPRSTATAPTAGSSSTQAAPQ